MTKFGTADTEHIMIDLTWIDVLKGIAIIGVFFLLICNSRGKHWLHISYSPGIFTPRYGAGIPRFGLCRL
jgi:hypothetical protein